MKTFFSFLTTATLAFTVAGCGGDDASFDFKVSRVASAGNGHTCNVRYNGTIACWGQNEHGQLGDGSKKGSEVPIQVAPDPVWVSVASGARHTCALRNDSWLWCWGWNEHGQLGTGSNQDQYQPLLTGAGSRWTQIAAGGVHSCAIRDDGTLWCWGNNNHGQIGNGSGGVEEDKVFSPEQIGDATTWSAIAAGEGHTCALRTDGSLWCWGNNSDGQIGDNTTIHPNTPQEIAAGSTWRSVDTGDFHTCAIRTDGSLWCWGFNQFGQLGDDTTTRSLAPTRIGEQDDWLAVELGDFHTCARRLDQSIWCWGSNAYGQLGDGTVFEMQKVPVQTTSENRWIDLTAGTAHTCGLWDDESLWCWGRNDYGQLGDDSKVNRSLPISVDYQ